MECNARPTQLDYPECWTYDVERLDAPDAGPDPCVPDHVRVGIAGWQSIADSLLARVDWDAAKHEATLTLERVESSVLGFREPPGVVLATLVLRDGGIRELRFGPGIVSRTHVASLVDAGR
jgi:hypothetical protein